MDPQTIKIPMPLKGVHRALSRDSQPEGTCFDALNVLPYDRQSRIRICQRPGLGTQKDLGTAAPVRMLQAVALGGGVTTGADLFYALNAQIDADNFTADGPLEIEASAWGVGTSSATSGIVGYLASLATAARTGTFTNPPMDYADATQELREIGIGVNHNGTAAAVSTANRTPADGFQVWISREGLPIAGTGVQYISARVDIPTLDTTQILTAAVDNTNTAYLYQGSTLLASQALSGSALTSGLWGIEVDGDTVRVVYNDASSADNVTPVITQTVTGQDTSRQGIGFGAMLNAVSTAVGIFLVPNGTYSDNRIIWVNQLTSGSISRARSKIVAVSGTNTFIGSRPGTATEVVNDGTYPIDATSLFVSAAQILSYSYIVDGTSIYKLNLETNLFEAYSATAGSAPTGCTIAVEYRGRLILSGTDSDSQNIFASRVDTPTDWDYSQEDPATAWAANAAPSGRVGQPVIALAPVSEDIMLIFCEQSIWRVEGDPADGGAIHPVTNSAGISGPNAWCIAEDGRIYFVGPSGFYRADKDGSNPVNLARDTYPQFFQAINRFTTHITLMYDQERHGVWVYLAPEDEDTAPAISMFYDTRLEGFWPMRFTNLPQAGPLSAIQWDAVGSDARYPLLGGYDGVLYWQSRNRRSDVDIDSVSHAIDSYVVLGPLNPTDPGNTIITRLEVTSGDELTSETSDFFNMDWQIRGGKTAYSVTEGTPVNVSGGNVPQASQLFIHVPRTRGSQFTIKLSNDTVNNYFGIESLQAYVVYGGKQR